MAASRMVLLTLGIFNSLLITSTIFIEDGIEMMAKIPGGLTTVGLEKPILPQDGEGPIRTIELPTFYMDKTEVTNEQFQNFVDSTGYVTEAEKFGNSFVLENFLSKELDESIKESVGNLKVANAPWWLPVEKAFWKEPEGPGSTIQGRMTHPVVHVSWNDASAYCQWAGKRLPFEAEWERACNGGKPNRLFPWGNRETKDGKWLLNIWQGQFPSENTADDGHPGYAAVGSFPNSTLGLHDMVGNVWEWTQDWFTSSHSSKEYKKGHPETGTDKVKKGGSFMCQKNFCYRYRCAARGHNTPDTSAYNLGFRCAKDEESERTPKSETSKKPNEEL